MGMLQTTRSHSIVYALITSKFATLAELRDVYDVYEALDLYEMYIVNAYNRKQIQDSLQKKH